MGHYLYHVQYTLLHNHKLFQTLLLSFLKASYAPYPDLPLSADIICRSSPPTELSIKEKEREERAGERQQAAVDTTTYFAYTGGILRGLKLLAGESPTGLLKRGFFATDLQNSAYIC